MKNETTRLAKVRQCVTDVLVCLIILAGIGMRWASTSSRCIQEVVVVVVVVVLRWCVCVTHEALQVFVPRVWFWPGAQRTEPSAPP